MLYATSKKPSNSQVLSDDTNKTKRISMWWLFAISLLTIPLFRIFDNKVLKEADLLTIRNLVLSEDSEFDPGGGKSSTPSIKFSFVITERRFILNYEEYQCVSNDTILANFRKGDTISIKIKDSDKGMFFKTNWFNKYTKLFGLAKGDKSYLSLDCRNKVSSKRASAATKASITSAILSLFFAVFILRPKTKYQALGQLPIDPIPIVLAAWLIIWITSR